MSEFQTVRNRRGHQPSQTIKYADQHQKLIEMGFDAASVTKALETSQGDLESATAILLGEERVDTTQPNNHHAEEYIVESKTSNKGAAKDSHTKNHSTSNNTNHQTKTSKEENIRETHQRMIATYKVGKCKEGANHDRRMCIYWHSLSDRRRNPFEFTYSCFDCPSYASTGECKDGDNCQHAHTMLEKMFHPELYKISMCQRTQRGDKCDRGVLCAFAHNEADLRVIAPSATPKVPPPTDWKPTKPIPDSPRLNTLLERIALLLKEAGPEGAGGTEIARKYSDRFHESMELEDEQKEKYKFRDLVATHPNITIVPNRGGPLRYLFDENKPAADAAASENGKADDSGKNDTQVINLIRDRLIQVIKSAGSEGVLGSDVPKKYLEAFGEKLDVSDESGSKIKLKDILASQPGITTQMLKLQPKYVYEGFSDATTPAPATVSSKPASNNNYSSIVGSNVNNSASAVTERVAPSSRVIAGGKSYSAVAATVKAALVVEPKQSALEIQINSPPIVNSSTSHHDEAVAAIIDDSAPSAEDPIFTQDNQTSDLDNRGILESNNNAFSAEPVTYQSAFGYGSVPTGVGSTDNGLIHSHDDHLLRKPADPLLGAPGLTKIHNQGGSSLDNSPNLSSFITNSNNDFHERLNLAQSQITTLQQTINKLTNDLHSKNQDYEGQTMQLRNVMQRLAEAENKTSNTDEHFKHQLKSKADELAQKSRDISKVEEESRKLREERKSDLNQFFINLSQIEDAISAMKCKEENYSEKIRPEDVQELLQFRKALRTFLTSLKMQLKQKFDSLVAQKPLEIEANSIGVTSGAVGTIPGTSNIVPQAPRYVPNPVNGGYEANYYAALAPRPDAFAGAYAYAPPVDTGICALPGCRNQGHYTCAGCQKVSYCGGEHQRLHWVQHSLNCHP